MLRCSGDGGGGGSMLGDDTLKVAYIYTFFSYSYEYLYDYFCLYWVLGCLLVVVRPMIKMDFYFFFSLRFQVWIAASSVPDN